MSNIMEMEAQHPDILKFRSICIALARIDNYTTHLDKTTFQKDSRTVDAVIRCLLIIGSSSAKISKSFKCKYSNIAWNDFVKCGKMALFQESQVWNLIRNDSTGLLKYLNPIKFKLSELGYKITANNSLDTAFSLSGLTRLANGEDEGSMIIIQNMVEEINRKENVTLSLKDIDIKNLIEVFSIFDETQKNLLEQKKAQQHRKILIENNEKRTFFYFSDLVLGIKLLARKFNGESIVEQRITLSDNRVNINLSTDYKFPIKVKSSIWTVRKK